MQEEKYNESTPLVLQNPTLQIIDDDEHRSGNKLGLINGVIVPCLLNIIGAILFLRLSWAVGQAGLGGVMIMLVLGTFQTSLTAVSLSALISNGEMRGGGAYYIISRAVGPELGGAIGLCFYFSCKLIHYFILKNRRFSN